MDMCGNIIKRVRSIDTILIKKDKLHIAADIIKTGGTVVFPTETVYGIGANALSGAAVEKIFTAKNRPEDNPLIVHISDLSEIEALTIDFTENAKILAKSFMPGPITLLLKKSEKIPSAVTAGLSTVGIRFPKNEIANELIRLSGLPIAAPSANISGELSGTTYNAVKAGLSGRVDCIIEGDDCDCGIESTVINVSCETPVILRPGSITYEMIKEELPSVTFHPSLLSDELFLEKPASPGMKYKHYAPKAKVVLVYGDIGNLKIKTGECVICFQEDIDKFEKNVYNVGSKNDLTEMARLIFEKMRQADTQSYSTIYVPAVAESGIGFSIMNRLKKSSGGEFITI